MRHIAKPQRRFVIHTAAIVTWLLSSISLSSHLLSILNRQVVTSIFMRSTHCASKHEDTNSKREDSKTLNPEGAGIICTRAIRGSVSRASTSVCTRKYKMAVSSTYYYWKLLISKWKVHDSIKPLDHVLRKNCRTSSSRWTTCLEKNCRTPSSRWATCLGETVVLHQAVEPRAYLITSSRKITLVSVSLNCLILIWLGDKLRQIRA